MDGKTLLYTTRQLLQESDSSSFLDDRTTYDYLYEAALDLVSQLKLLTASQTVTTVAGTSLYNLNADYLCLYLKNDENDYVVRYYDGSGYYWPTFREASFMFQANSLSDSAIPDNWSITDKQTLDTSISGATTSAGASSGGECTLTDTGADFSDVSVGDQVHNVDDGSDGVIIEKTSTTALVTALFGGTANDWTSADDYVIIPQAKKQLYVDPPSLTPGHSIILRYVPKPDPVYSSYRTYRIPNQYLQAITKYAAWLYKYRDREPNYGDAWYKYWEMQLRKHNMNENRLPSRQRFGVNFKKRTFGHRSMR